MNRKIEFRGKCVPDSKYAGKWVTGGYIAPDADCKKQDEGLIISYFGGNSTSTCHVITDTVGEFTGMKDKHGNKVFEGDIVEVYDFTTVYSSKYRGVVKEYRGSWRVEHEGYGTVFHTPLFFDDFADRKTEVIGNIYDNPELLNKN